MLCEKCKTNPATVHYKYNENGNVTEAHLCAECAKMYGLIGNGGKNNSGLFSNGGFFDNYFANIPLASVFGSGNSAFATSKQRICPGCGLSEHELRSGGKFGCAECYKTFADIVNQMFLKMHQSCEYKGKMPEGRGEQLSVTSKIEKLKADMQVAVNNQEYEEAAKIRDAIKQLEDSENDSKE